ncbi:MAG TPA: Pls/PosA family non-ribosomal peptide synthetase, partial [Pseudonocardiaceae bacterium]|nr:Pls/PosA family non-ribosomal peptide synthetase [Pseudonocardiaceae bacterium]
MGTVSEAYPAESTEQALAEVLAEVARVERVPVDSHFFDDLGANSLVMAHFCARVRKRADLPSVSIKDVYRHPTIRSLAAQLIEPQRPEAQAAPIESSPPAPAEVPTPVSGPGYVLCGLVQLLTFLGYSYLAALVAVLGYEWISASSGLLEAYLRSAVFAAASLLGLCLLPILAKWLLIGRWREQRIRVWSMAYVRFWIVKTLIRANPLALFAGSPLYVLYLRALGARIGRGVVIFSRHVPVCTDLLTIGDNTVIRRDSYFAGYRAHAGQIETGPVTLGRDVFVGEAAVIDIGTSMGDGAQLGRASSLHPGQAVPAGECWHGSPALRAETDYRTLDGAGGSTLRRALFSGMQVLSLLALSWPLAVGGLAIAREWVPRFDALLNPGPLAFTSWTFYGDALAVSFVLFFGVLLGRFLIMLTVPRALNRAITPGAIYPLYGFHFWIHRAIARLTNIKFFMSLFGDSSYIVHYLRAVGYDISHVGQTGSNFGTDVKHDNPYLCSVGQETMVADGLTMISAEYSSSSFRVSRTSIGGRNFLGNHIIYPPRGRTGDNCLLATKV